MTVSAVGGVSLKMAFPIFLDVFILISRPELPFLKRVGIVIFSKIRSMLNYTAKVLIINIPNSQSWVEPQGLLSQSHSF